MIIIRFHGGLGNQMFEYVFYEYIKSKYNTTVLADITWYDRNYKEHQGYELEDVFGIRLDKADYKTLGRIHEYYPKYYSFSGFRFLSREIAKIRNRFRKNRCSHIYDFDKWKYSMNPAFIDLNINLDWYIEGVYCSDTYVKALGESILGKFKFRYPQIEGLSELRNRLKNENSVAIHVRRGDYIGKSFDVVTMDYYKKAVKLIEEKVLNPVFYIFSDDMEYIEREFTFIYDYTPIHYGGKNSYLDMAVMSECKHMIIANSTFSYWAAMLGEDKDSIIIAPAQYKADETESLSRDNWIKL